MWLRVGCWSLSQLHTAKGSLHPWTSHQLIPGPELSLWGSWCLSQGCSLYHPSASSATSAPCNICLQPGLDPKTLHSSAPSPTHVQLTRWGCDAGDDFLLLPYKIQSVGFASFFNRKKKKILCIICCNLFTCPHLTPK